MGQRAASDRHFTTTSSRSLSPRTRSRRPIFGSTERVKTFDLKRRRLRRSRKSQKVSVVLVGSTESFDHRSRHLAGFASWKAVRFELPKDPIGGHLSYSIDGFFRIHHQLSRVQFQNHVSLSTLFTDLPDWSFDGSSTSQAEGKDSDVFLHPVAIFKDPFLGGPNKLVMCECQTKDKEPHPSNKRASCKEACDLAEEEKPWFGIEQEYTLLDPQDGHPYKWPKKGYPGPQGTPI